MPSTHTERNRFEKQGTGENEHTWGERLNEKTFDLMDEALDGVTKFTLSGTKTLSSTNAAADESRDRQIWITGGTGGTVTIPAGEKCYLVHNGASGAVVFTTGSGDTASIAAGGVGWITTDGTDVYADNGANAGTASASATAAAASAVAAEASATAAAASETAAAASAASVNASNLMHLSGAETATGLKTFSAGIRINSQTLNGLTATGLALAQAPSAADARTTLELTKASTAQTRAHAADVVMTAANVGNACALVQLTDAATVAVDWTSFVTAYVTLGGDRTLGNPTNVVPGTFRTIFVEAASGTRGLTFGSNYKGALPTIADVTTTKQYVLTLCARSATHIVVVAARSL